MSRIGIVTIIDYDNYGNRLQNYAVQEILKNKGFETITIKNEPEFQKPNFFIRLKNLKLYRIKRKINNKLIEKKITKKYKQLNTVKKERLSLFLKFTNERIIETPSYLSLEGLKNIEQEFDYFVVGSDQVWNPNFRHCSPIDFLGFTNKRKKIALSPSFGVSNLKPEAKNIYTNALSDFKALSCREHAGAKIITELTGVHNVPVLIDPTLMIDSEDWKKVAKESVYKPKEKYLLTYILGNVSNERQKFINEFANRNKLKIFNLADSNDYDAYRVGPAEFIDLIKDSEVFFTDSFHGSVFSILFEIPFLIFEREDKTESMNSRLETLSIKFSLSDRFYYKGISDESIWNPNYTNTNKLLVEERRFFNEYIDRALKD